ncbi:unnamed protein product [Heligmosomoides polygyrus]|uniref:Reverse transcriptase domain-containing protein n=1 Tax=Heligmosomoides polygyrus TaxID=6339 RepID=A0A183G2K2_HELPZ|nr:unnamed protein product [Heligmosomoides polygyrus]
MEAIVQEFYTDLFRSSITVPKCLMPPAEEVPPVLESEVAHAIRRMRPGTAPGPDGISAGLVRAGGSALFSILAKHFSHYLRLGRIPDSWKESKPVPIFRKVSRMISTTIDSSVFSRLCTMIFTNILLNRMERCLDEYHPVEQAGFRKDFSCMDHTHTVPQFIERSREYHIPLALVFVDYRKAFDYVEINAILNVLVHAGIPSPYIRLFNELRLISASSLDRSVMPRLLGSCTTFPMPSARPPPPPFHSNANLAAGTFTPLLKQSTSGKNRHLR